MRKGGREGGREDLLPFHSRSRARTRRPVSPPAIPPHVQGRDGLGRDGREEGRKGGREGRPLTVPQQVKSKDKTPGKPARHSTTCAGEGWTKVAMGGGGGSVMLLLAEAVVVGPG